MAFDIFKRKEDSGQAFAQSAGDKHGVTRDRVEQLAKEAGHMIAMFEHVYADTTERLRMVSALAGYACHQAVKANQEKFITTQTKDNREYYFGDDLNYYLLEGPFSVLVFIKGFYERKTNSQTSPDIQVQVQRAVSNIGNDLYKIWNQEFPELLYGRVKECWAGIYQNMTGRYCNTAAEWPVLFGIVLQNIMFQSELEPEDTFYKALECALFISKMDEKSVKNKNLNEIGDEILYRFYQDGRPLPLSAEDDAFLHTSIDTLRDFFKENAIAFDVTNRGQDTKVFHFKMTIQGELTTVLVGLVLKPKMCSIVFTLPFTANLMRETELYKVLMQYNCTRRFGAFLYDRTDGQINYKTDFPCSEGMKKEDFVAAFIISMNSISKFMDELKPYVIRR